MWNNSHLYSEPLILNWRKLLNQKNQLTFSQNHDMRDHRDFLIEGPHFSVEGTECLAQTLGGKVY